MVHKSIILLFLLTIALSVFGKPKTTILPGAFQTDDYFPMLKGKTIGIVANQTSTIGRKHLVDSLLKSGFTIKCVFAPEHGFRGNNGAGEEIKNNVDSLTGIPIVSLYGKHLGPDSNELKGIDLMIFDIQDVGVRFYTYISTLQYVMESCAKHNIPLIILDRPNPNGFYIDGPILETNYASFIGMQPIPVVYGMTIGEYAKMINGEKWLRNKKQCNLKVIPVRNYYHSTKYRLPIPPSPNLPDLDAIYLYPSICFFEGTVVSLGRGTNKPFRLIGFPSNVSGNITFKPEVILGVAPNPPYRDTVCSGFDLSGEGIKLIGEKKIQLKWLMDMYSTYPDKEKFFTDFFDKLAGNSVLRKQILHQKSEAEIRKSWEKGIQNFKGIRKKYLIYVDFE